MDITKKYKWAVTGLVVVVLLNVVTLLVVWLDKPDRDDWSRDRDGERGRNAVHQYMQKELELSDEQADSIVSLRRNHFREIRNLQRNLIQHRKNYFDRMAEGESSEIQIQDSLANVIAENYVEIEKAMYRHIAEMKEVLNPEQQQKFQELMKEIFLRDRSGNRGEQRSRQSN